MIERLEATVDHVLTCHTLALKIGRSRAPNHQYYRVGAPGLSGAPRRHAKFCYESHLSRCALFTPTIAEAGALPLQTATLSSLVKLSSHYHALFTLPRPFLARQMSQSR